MANNIDALLDSSAPVEAIAGELLEQLVGAGQSQLNNGLFISNIAAQICGVSPGTAPSDRMLVVLEAFQWLQSRDMLASGSQAGSVFVTRKGKEIKTGAGLKPIWISSRAVQKQLIKMRRRI